MSEALQGKVLVVAGDYEVLHKTSVALQESTLTVQGAFSHRDAQYLMENEPVSLAIVDVAMFDRVTGDYTASSLERFQHVPMILYSRDGLPSGYAQPPVEIVIGALDRRTIWRSVMSILNVSSPSEMLEAEAVDFAGEIRTFFALSKSLTEVLDLSEVLNRVVEAARHLTDAEEGMILLPDDEAGQLYLRARVGIDDEAARNFRIKTDDTLAGQVFYSGEPVLIGKQGPQKVKTQYFVNSLLYVPILLQGKSIGVLGVNNKTSDEVFDNRHSELLMNLASYAAIAIENARIHEEALERTRELQSLVEASEVVNASVALFETLPNICKQLVRVLNVGWSAILEWDREQDQLQTLARHQQMCWRPGQGPTVTLEPDHFESLMTRSYLRIEPDNLNVNGRRNSDLLTDAGVEAMILVPVLADGQLLGAVRAFYLREPDEGAIRNVVQSVHHAALEGLMAVTSPDSLSAMSRVLRLLEEIKRRLGANWCELATWSASRQRLAIQAVVGAGVWVQEPYPTISLAEYPDLKEALIQQVPIAQSSDGDSRNGLRRLLELTASHSVLGLPLVQRGQTQGLVLFGDTWYARLFDEHEIDMGRAIVGQAATALENARLVHDLEYSIQELKDTQARLVQTARLSAMGELSAAVAHQINNPLTTILVDTELMLLDEPQDSRNHQSLQAISRAGKRAASVVRRLLATARPSEENAPSEPIDIVDTIEGILSLVKPHIEQDHIQVLSRLPQESLPPVWAVQGQLDDIWLNLLLNAHDALIGVENATIGIEVDHRQGDKAIEVSVWDNGPGIPEYLIEEVFKPFFTTKPVGEGTGLGLHICKQVVEGIHGSITVESARGEGTRFLVRLPVEKGFE